MRAEALGEAGNRLQTLNDMLEREEHYLERTRKLSDKVNLLLKGKLKRRKKKQLTALRDRFPAKLNKSESILRQMKKRKQELFSNLIIQRESLGITEHSWIYKFYRAGDKE